MNRRSSCAGGMARLKLAQQGRYHGMKILLDSNLMIKNVFEPPLEWHFEGDSISLRTLLQKVKERCASLKILQDGEEGDDVRNILINGKDYFLIGRLDAILNDRDRVALEIYLDPLGGG